jgi:hypothetical protein
VPSAHAPPHRPVLHVSSIVGTSNSTSMQALIAHSTVMFECFAFQFGPNVQSLATACFSQPLVCSAVTQYPISSDTPSWTGHSDLAVGLRPNCCVPGRIQNKAHMVAQSHEGTLFVVHKNFQIHPTILDTLHLHPDLQPLHTLHR